MGVFSFAFESPSAVGFAFDGENGIFPMRHLMGLSLMLGGEKIFDFVANLIKIFLRAGFGAFGNVFQELMPQFPVLHDIFDDFFFDMTHRFHLLFGCRDTIIIPCLPESVNQGGKSALSFRSPLAKCRNLWYT